MASEADESVARATLARDEGELAAKRERVAELNAKIHEATETITTSKLERNKLNIECATLQTAIKSQKQELHPVRRLPHDVLGELFKEAMRPAWAFYDESNLLTGTSIVGHKRMIGSRFSFALAAVCTTWRKVALDTPVLWHRILLNMEKASRRRDAWAASVLRCLERSKSVPLTVVFSSVAPGWKDNWLEVIWALVGQSLRLRNLVVEAQNGAALQMMLGYLPRPLPSLTTLMLKSWDSSTLTLELDLPNIRNLSLAGLDVTLAFACEEQMRNLTRLDLLGTGLDLGGGHTPPESVWNILSGCPGLWQLSLSLPSNTPAETAGPVTCLYLPLLTKLTLDGLPACKVVATLGGKRLFVPSLRDIVFSNSGKNPEQWSKVIGAFKNTIETISFSVCDLTGVPDRYLDVPGCLSRITTQDCQIKREFFDDLQACELPNLQHLKFIEGTMFISKAAAALVSFVEDRMYRPARANGGRVARLETVAVEERGLVDTSSMGRIQRALISGADARAKEIILPTACVNDDP